MLVSFRAISFYELEDSLFAHTGFLKIVCYFTSLVLPNCIKQYVHEMHAFLFCLHFSNSLFISTPTTILYSVKWTGIKCYRWSILIPDNTVHSNTYTAEKVTSQWCSKSLQEVVNLLPSYIPELEGVNQKGINQTQHSHKK